MTYQGEGVADAGPTEDAPAALARGTTVHRYVILERVGEGGMGVVYAAFDPGLDRRVALKFLRRPEASRGGVRERRLLREAQAMARLSHPNVAVAYEVGTFQGHIFLAMEFVDGVDLHTWLTEEPRTVSQVLELFQAAGRGLAAAHAADIVHRDFKPENVLVDRHGRPRVTDFGLSRASHEPDEDDDPEPAADHLTASSGPSHLSMPLTAAGRVLGTPSYMAPEQHLGDADARSDQFAFCVALYGALYGEHPFGKIRGERRDNAMAGLLAPAPPQSSVPRWCRQVLQRGLAAAPEDRFPSMEALLAALAPRPRSRSRQIAIAALLGFALAGAGAYALAVDRSAASTTPRCDRGAERLAGVWDAARKARLREAFQRVGGRGADVTWSGFSAIVDQRAGAWAAMHDEACAATHVRGMQSPAILDLRVECLERKRQEIGDLVDVYSGQIAARDLDRAVAAADKLSSVRACADVANLRAVVPLPEDRTAQATVRSIRQRLGHSRALYDAGRYEQGREYMESLKREADAVGYPPLAAEAANALAVHLGHAGKLKEAEAVLLEATRQAVDGHDWNQEADAWLELVANYDRDGLVREARLAATVADLAVRRANGDESMYARLESTLRSAHALDGDMPSALRHAQRSAELWKRSRGASSLKYAEALKDIGTALLDRGRYREALGYLDQALQLRQAKLRSDHPDIADSLSSLGVAHLGLGQLHEGRELLRRSFEIRSKELGPEHRLTTRTLQTMASADLYLGEYDRALELDASLLSIRTLSLDPHDVTLGTTYADMGTSLRRAGRTEEAERMFEQVIEQLARAGTPAHFATGHVLTSLGLIHNERRRHRQALDECRRALDILSRNLGPDSPMLIDTRECIGEALIAQGDAAAARQELERAVRSIDDAQAGPQWTAGVRFQLARAMWATPGDRRRARELARATLDELVRAEGDNRELVRRIRRWLAATSD
jgi:eukaryotic-like serine/threonine-protein kinase